MTSMYDALIKAGFTVGHEKSVPLLPCNKLLPKRKERAKKAKSFPTMGAMQEAYQGTRTCCADTFDLTGKNGKLPRKKIAHVYVETKPGRLEVFKENQHIYVPVQGKHWFLSKGVRLQEYKQDGKVYYILPTR